MVSPPDGQATLTVDDQRFYALRGGKSLDGGKTVRYLVLAFAPCSAHDTVDKKCAIYDARPLTCREFPSTPGQIEGTPCAYWFEDAEGNRRGGGGSPYPTQPVFE